ncbi:MAG: hypothetical protein JST04_00865 [Bdellovibrionales bacterium]|nr:hypothetical protein [Bdellovibrionales bacterium]
MESRKEPALKIVHVKSAAEEAKEILRQERDGKQRGWKCRFPAINAGMLKYWRPGFITMIASSSGGGKSFLLNMIEEDFLNIELNGESIYEPYILHFNFEMKGEDEILRNISGKMEKSYAYLRSSEIKQDNTGYNNLSDEELEQAINYLDKMSNKKLFYVENSGNINQIRDTIKYFVERYKINQVDQVSGKVNKLIVSFDHALLIKRLEERDEIALVADFAKYIIEATKEDNLTTIVLNQLNGNIEQPVRKDNPNNHYPLKTDIHGSNQLYHACDNVIIVHRPELIGIELYGPRSIKTKGLVHGNGIKYRHGQTGSFWLIAELNKGRFRPLTEGEKLNMNITRSIQK